MNLVCARAEPRTRAERRRFFTAGFDARIIIEASPLHAAKMMEPSTS
jgi:hypothetical protein